MKRLFLLSIFGLIGTVSANAQYNETTVYGLNEGTVIDTKPDGSSTTEIKCNNMFQYVCYTKKSTGPTKGFYPTPTNKLSFAIISYNSKNEISDVFQIENVYKIEERGDRTIYYSSPQKEPKTN